MRKPRNSNMGIGSSNMSNTGMSNWCSNVGVASICHWCGSWCSNMGVASICHWCGNSMNCRLVNNCVVLVNHRGFHNMLDRVNNIGFGYSIRLRYFYGIRFGNMFFDNHFTFNGDRDGYWDLNLVFVNLKLRFNTGNLWGHNGVGANRGLNFGDGHGVSRCRSLVSGCGRDGSIWQGCCRDDWRSNRDSGFRSFGRFSHISVCRRLVNRLFLGVGVAYLDRLNTNLDGVVSHNFLVSLMDGWARNNMLMNLCSHYWWGNNVGNVANMSNWCSNVGVASICHWCSNSMRCGYSPTVFTITFTGCSMA